MKIGDFVQNKANLLPLKLGIIFGAPILH